MRAFINGTAAAIVLLILLEGGPVQAGGIRAGVARVSITPHLPMWLNGYASREKPATGVLHDLWAKALVLEENPKSRVVIVTTDLLGLSHQVSERVAAVVRQKYGLERSQLLLNSSHTHSGPVVWPCLDVIYDFKEADQRLVSQYTEQLTENLVRVIDTAMSQLLPVQLSSGHGSTGFAINRRNKLFPAGPVDHDVPVLKVATPDGKLMAVLFGYACHNTTLVDDNYLFNGDYAGFAQIALEKAHPGATAMFMMGCGGDQNPEPRGTVALAQQHGRSLADAVTQVLSQPLRPVRAPIRTDYTRVDLPFRPVDPQVYQRDMVRTDRFLQRRARLMLEAYNKGWGVDRLAYPVQVVRFSNDLTILALSGEVVVDYALAAKKEFAPANLFVAGYSNEVMYYIPSRRVLAEGGYEGESSMIYYGFPGPFSDGIEERIFGAIRKMMKHPGSRSSK